MAQQLALKIVDQRAATARLRWLTLRRPRWPAACGPANYLLLRCAELGGYDPLLRRALFVAAAEPALGSIGLLYEPSERGLAWPARGRPGDMLDAIGPLGQPFALDERSRNLLLVGQGPGLAALLLLASAASARGCAVTLFAGAADADALPPPFLLSRRGRVPSSDRTRDRLARTNQRPRNQEPRTKNRRRRAALVHPFIRLSGRIASSPPCPTTRSRRCTMPFTRSNIAGRAASPARCSKGPLICGVGACGVCATGATQAHQAAV